MSKALNAIRKGLKQDNPEVEIYRHQSGYYYFTGRRGVFFGSIHVWLLDEGDVNWVLKYAASERDKYAHLYEDKVS